MRIGIFSDVHANLEALQAVAKYFLEEKIEKSLFIGDLVGYGANPNECVEIVQKLNSLPIAGNHDYGVIGKSDISTFNHAAQSAITWTQKILTNKSIKFIKSLLIRNAYRNNLLIHSSPEKPDDWRYVLTLKEAENQFNYFREKICFIGHSHLPCVVEKNDANNEVKIINHEKFGIRGDNYQYLINVGSVGQPRDGNSRACVFIFDTKMKIVEMKRLEYNYKLTQEKILNAGLPPVLAYRLTEGK
jgi:predicted phosphodiesterase